LHFKSFSIIFLDFLENIDFRSFWLMKSGKKPRHSIHEESAARTLASGNDQHGQQEASFFKHCILHPPPL
jgi:hypothetical protein